MVLTLSGRELLFSLPRGIEADSHSLLPMPQSLLISMTTVPSPFRSRPHQPSCFSYSPRNLRGIRPARWVGVEMGAMLSGLLDGAERPELTLCSGKRGNPRDRTHSRASTAPPEKQRQPWENRRSLSRHLQNEYCLAGVPVCA